MKNVVFLTTDVHATLVNDARFKTLEPGGPVNSGILDVTVGPAATANFAPRDRRAKPGSRAPGASSTASSSSRQPPTGVGMQCSILDQFSYGEVEVTSSKLTVTPKDINGVPQTTPTAPAGHSF